MLRILNDIVDIPLLDGRAVKGVLKGNINSWSFSSPDVKFTQLFPAGVVYSFSEYGNGRLLQEQQQFQNIIAQKAKDILDEKLFSQGFQAMGL